MSRGRWPSRQTTDSSKLSLSPTQPVFQLRYRIELIAFLDQRLIGAHLSVVHRAPAASRSRECAARRIDGSDRRCQLRRAATRSLKRESIARFENAFVQQHRQVDFLN